MGKVSGRTKDKDGLAGEKRSPQAGLTQGAQESDHVDLRAINRTDRPCFGQSRGHLAARRHLGSRTAFCADLGHTFFRSRFRSFHGKI